MIASAKLHAITPTRQQAVCHKKDFSGLWKQTLPKGLFSVAPSTLEYRLMIRSNAPVVMLHGNMS